MGITDRPTSRAIFDAVTSRAEIPPEVERSEPYRDRKDVRELFEYMRGFRDYHLKDIQEAWKYATREVYRGFFLRFGLYSGDSDGYVRGVKAFQSRLDEQQRTPESLRGQVTDVERVPRKERLHEDGHAQATQVEALRGRHWDEVASTGLLTPETVAAERIRELPR